MYRTLTLFILIALAIVGCSLSSGDDSTAEETEEPVIVIDNGETDPLPTNTPQPTNTPAPSNDDDGGADNDDDDNNGNSGSGNTGDDNDPICVVRTDWPTYTVVSGDTTSRIAQRTGTTTGAIANANCLSDASRISVGQQLRVPRQPDPDVVVQGFLSLSNYTRLDGDTYVLPGNGSVSLTWNSIPTTLSRVNYLLYPPDGLSYTVLGSDSNIFDGVAINWQLPANTTGFIIARGENSSGREVAISPQLKITTGSGSVVDGSIDISPIFGTDGNTILLEEGRNISVRWDEAANHPGMGQAEFVFYPSNNGNAISMGVDTNPSNGAAITWTVPQNITGRITVGGRFTDHNTVTAVERVVRSETGAEVKRGNIAVAPNLGINANGMLELESGTTVTVMWNDGPSFTEASSVTFYWGEVGIGGGSWIEIATDNNLGNGLSVEWGVPGPNTQGTIFAESTLNDGTRVISSVDEDFVTVVDSGNNQEIRGTISISPNNGTQGGWVQLTPGQQVTISWNNAPPFPEVTSATFYTAPTGTGSIGTAIGTDNNIADGTSITWTVPNNFGGHVYAEAGNGTDEYISQTASINTQN